MSETRSKVLPSYVLIDTSESMTAYEHLLNDTIDDVLNVLSDEPSVAEYAHVSILTFNTDAHVVLPMSDVSEVTSVPNIACTGSTNYGAAFHLLRQRIEHDYNELSRSRNVQRAAVFMLTDGEPMDRDWAVKLDALDNPAWRLRPAIISYGFGGANDAILKKVGNAAAYQATEAQSEKGAITSMLASMLVTLTGSARAQQLLIPPGAPDGWTRIPTDLGPETHD